MLLRNITIEFLDAPLSPTAERIRVACGVVCKNCGELVEQFWYNGQPTKHWTHVKKPWRHGASFFCAFMQPEGKFKADAKAEPLIEEARQ